MSEIVLPRLYERDIDVLLQEELIFCGALRRLIARELRLDNALEVGECRLSVVDSTGETDVYAFFSAGPRRGVLLIENKIDAGFQPLQPERYRERARALANEFGEDAVFCLLIAPASYLRARNAQTGIFDAAISYEDAAAAIDEDSTPRSKHRAALIRSAVERARSSYVLSPVAEVGNLWARIYNIASREFPQLNMSPPKEKGSQSKWIIFKADLPPRVTIDWKITQATVDLSFWPRSISKALPSIPFERSPENSGLGRVGETEIIRIGLSHPPNDWISIGDDQIREALAASTELLSFFRTNRSVFS